MKHGGKVDEERIRSLVESTLSRLFFKEMLNSIFSKDVNPGGIGGHPPTFWTEGDTYIIIPPLFAKFMTTEA